MRLGQLIVPSCPPCTVRSLNRNRPRPLVPLLPLCGLDPIDGVLPIIFVPLRSLRYPVEIVGVPVYLGLGGREGVPIRPCLVLVPFQLLLLSGIELVTPIMKDTKVSDQTLIPCWDGNHIV